MGADIRFYAVSLAAVFIAILFGMAVGVTFSNQAKLEQMDQRIEQRIRKEINRLESIVAAQQRREAQMQEQIKTQEDSLRRFALLAVSGRLAGKRVAIVHTTGLDNFAQLKDALTAVLEQAGATVSSVTVFNADPSAVPSEVLLQLAQQLQIAEADEPVIRQRLAQAAARAIAQGDARVMNALRNAGVLRYNGDLSQPAHAALLIGGLNGEDPDAPQRVDLPMAKTFKGLYIACVGCEPTEVVQSFISEYQRVQIPTVDNVDTLVGQVAVVFALSGHQGNFGVKGTADSLLPTVK